MFWIVALSCFVPLFVRNIMFRRFVRSFDALFCFERMSFVRSFDARFFALNERTNDRSIDRKQLVLNERNMLFHSFARSFVCSFVRCTLFLCFERTNERTINRKQLVLNNETCCFVRSFVRSMHVFCFVLNERSSFERNNMFGTSKRTKQLALNEQMIDQKQLVSNKRSIKNNSFKPTTNKHNKQSQQQATNKSNNWSKLFLKN
jgi:hypothetical protein